MRKMVITLLALGVFAASTAFAAGQVRISQVYGGSSAVNYFNQDYVELFNSGGDLDISGWAVEYSSSASTALWGGSGSTWQTYFVFPAGTTIKACSYLLLGCASATGGTPLSPVPDFVVAGAGYLNLSASTGRVGLFSAYYAGAGCGVEGAVLLDKVAFGTAACPEGTASAPAPSAILAIFRGAGGMNDTDQNSVDFVTGTPAPRNSAVALRNPLCLATPATSTTWGKVKTIYR
jgi:hypothetical protein